MEQFDCLEEPCWCTAFLVRRCIPCCFANDLQCKRLGCEWRERIAAATLRVKSRRQAPDAAIAKFRCGADLTGETRISLVIDDFKSEDATACTKKLVRMHFSRRMEYCCRRSAFSDAAAISFAVTTMYQDGKVRTCVHVSPNLGPGPINRLGKAHISRFPLIYNRSVKTAAFKFWFRHPTRPEMHSLPPQLPLRIDGICLLG